MKKAYIEIPELTDDEFLLVSGADNALTELKKIIPSAQGYTTCFAHKGKIYHTDTYSDENNCKLENLYHNVGKVVSHVPTQEVRIEVPVDKPNTYSEQMFLKALNVAIHGL